MIRVMIGLESQTNVSYFEVILINIILPSSDNGLIMKRLDADGRPLGESITYQAKFIQKIWSLSTGALMKPHHNNEGNMWKKGAIRTGSLKGAHIRKIGIVTHGIMTELYKCNSYFTFSGLTSYHNRNNKFSPEILAC